MLVSVLTPTIPGRERLLEECEASVKAQTVDAWEHLVMLDDNHQGCAVTMNKLSAAAVGDWLLPLADDDLLLPRCVETLLAHAEGADVVYAPPLVSGNEDRWWFFQAPPAIPSFGLIRADLWRSVGGYNEALAHEEDRDFWTEAMKQDARFVRVDEPCWVYRQWQKADGTPGNKSFSKVTA